MTQSPTKSQTLSLIREKILEVKEIVASVENKLNITTPIVGRLNNLIDILDDGYGKIIVRIYQNKVHVCIDVTPIYDLPLCRETNARTVDDINSTAKQIIVDYFADLVARISMSIKLDRNIDRSIVEEEVKKLDNIVKEFTDF